MPLKRRRLLSLLVLATPTIAPCVVPGVVPPGRPKPGGVIEPEPPGPDSMDPSPGRPPGRGAAPPGEGEAPVGDPKAPGDDVSERPAPPSARVSPGWIRRHFPSALIGSL